MGKLDLQPPLGGRRALAENLEDQPGAVDHLGVERGLQIALLDGGETRIENRERGILHAERRGELVDLALADKCRRARRAQPQRDPVGHRNADGRRQPRRLGEPGVGIARRLPLIGQHHHGPRAARKFAAVALKAFTQWPSPASSARLSGLAGCTVDTACL